MSSKMLFIVIALAIFIAALFVFLKKTDSKIVIQELQNQPKLRLVQYEFYRVKNDVETARLVGKDANLMEGNHLLLSGGVRGTRVRDGKREEFSSDSGQVDFAGSNPGMLSGDLQAKTARFNDNVQLVSGDMRFETEEVRYSQEQQLVYTSVPVTIRQRSQNLESKGGFQYNLNTERLKMAGGVSGNVSPKELKETKKRRTPQ